MQYDEYACDTLRIVLKQFANIKILVQCVVYFISLFICYYYRLVTELCDLKL